MSKIPDYNDLWAAHDAEQQRQLENLPKCCECDEPIQDEHCFVINDEPMCESCLYSNYRKAVEDLID